MKVFKKDIVTRQGVDSANQAVSEIKVSLYMDGVDPNSSFAQPATIEISLFKDKDAIVAQKSRLETKTYTIADVSQLASYPALVQELISIMVTDEASPMFGATVEDTEPEPVA